MEIFNCICEVNMCLLEKDPFSMLSSCEVTEIHRNPEIEGLFEWSYSGSVIEILAEMGMTKGNFLVLAEVKEECYRDYFTGECDVDIIYKYFIAIPVKKEIHPSLVLTNKGDSRCEKS